MYASRPIKARHSFESSSLVYLRLRRIIWPPLLEQERYVCVVDGRIMPVLGMFSMIWKLFLRGGRSQRDNAKCDSAREGMDTSIHTILYNVTYLVYTACLCRNMLSVKTLASPDRPLS